MKKLYLTILMLAMMVAALNFAACGGDAETVKPYLRQKGSFAFTASCNYGINGAKTILQTNRFTIDINSGACGVK